MRLWPARSTARLLQIALGLAISALLIWWVFRHANWDASWRIMVASDPRWMLLAVVLATVPFPLRVPRWRVLLRHDTQHAVGAASLWHAIAMGFAANNVLPLRAGEVIRGAALSRLGHIPVATALSSIAVERALDVLVAAALLSLALLSTGFDSDLTLGSGSAPLGRLAVVVGALGLGALILAALAAWQSGRALRLLRWVLPSGKAGDALYHFGDRLLRGLGALRDLRAAIPLMAWSLVIWLCNASAFYVAFQAFGFSIPFSGALILQGALMVGIAMPSSPGYFGVFEAAIAGTLATLYEIPYDAGFAYGLLYHVTTFVPITILGAMSMVQTGMRGSARPMEVA